jgi:hypothetical protein
MTRKIDHKRLGQLREGQGEIANHIIDEFAAGRLSRRDFIRRGTVVGFPYRCSGRSSPPAAAAGRARLRPAGPPPPRARPAR